MIGSKGLFGKRNGMPGIVTGFGGGTFDMDGTQVTPTYSMPQDATVRDGANLGAQAPRQGGGWKNVLLNALGGAADGAATFFGGQPLIAQQRQFDMVQRQRLADEQRRRSEALADFRTQMQIRAEFETPEAPKVGSFEWFQTATPEQRAEYSRYMDVTNPAMTTTWQGPTIIPRASLGGAAPTAPVGKLTPIQPNIANTPVPQVGASGMPTVLTRQQYQAVVNEMGQADTEAWARRHNVRIVD